MKVELAIGEAIDRNNTWRLTHGNCAIIAFHALYTLAIPDDQLREVAREIDLLAGTDGMPTEERINQENELLRADIAARGLRINLTRAVVSSEISPLERGRIDDMARLCAAVVKDISMSMRPSPLMFAYSPSIVAGLS